MEEKWQYNMATHRMKNAYQTNNEQQMTTQTWMKIRQTQLESNHIKMGKE